MKSRLWAGAIAACIAAPASAAPLDSIYSSLFVLGDSLSDIGNINPSPLPDPYYDAPFPYSRQWSNGPVWADILDDEFGSGLPDPMTGEIKSRNYAFGGATSNAKVPDVMNGGAPIDPPSPSLGDQVGLMLADLSDLSDPFPDTPTPGDTPLTAMLFGANDVFAALGALQAPVWDLGTSIAYIDAAAANVVAAITTISRLPGFDDFVVINLPDISDTPGVLGNSVAQDLSVRFNQQLAMGIAAIEGPGTDIEVVDFFSLFKTTIAGIEAGDMPFGLTDGETPCVITRRDPTTGANVVVGQPCEDPDEFLFFDPVHPNRVAHAEIARVVATQVIPLPAGMPPAACRSWRTCGAAQTFRLRFFLIADKKRPRAIPGPF